ncbi:MAG TPA: FAD-dependent monooxygenase [Candidatus Dormibacteraeota bacterium]|nr:FAD-dependent monooxygenase [Candidatus Dormibacteraeota bacterium]
MEYDALIVGARVAGASLALLLAKQGRRVLLVDRDRFPSDTLSTHFVAFNGIGLLARLGVLGDVEAAGFRRISRHRTWVEDVLLEVPAGPSGAYSLAPRRDVLDSVLVKHAVAAGASLAERTRAEALLLEGDRVVGAVVQEAGGGRREVRARVVVGADGKYSKVAEWVGAEKYAGVPALRPVYYGYLLGVEPLPVVAMEMWFVAGQIGFLFPMRAGEDCIALEIQPGDFDSFRSDPVATFWERLQTLPGLADRLRNARLEGKLQGSRGIENHFRKPFGPGWALTGDAGYLKDPSTGLGITDALTQSFLLAKALDGWFGGVDWETAMAGFQRERDESVMPSYRYTLAVTERVDREGGFHRLDVLRALAVSPHLGRVLVEALPDLANQVLEPADQARVAIMTRLYRPTEQPAAG